MTITLPPLPSHPEHCQSWTHMESRAIRKIQREAMRVALEAAAQLKADAMEIFNHDPAMTPQETRDVIEWYDASIRALEIA